MSDKATLILIFIAFALQQFDEATREEQARDGKTAAELLDSSLLRVNANDELGQQLAKKFAQLEKTDAESTSSS